MKAINGKEVYLELFPVRMLCLWIFVSPFYYFWNFYTGNLLSGLDENFLHRILKYVFALCVCMLFFLKRPNLNILNLYLFFLLCFLFFVLLSVGGFDTRIQVVLLLTLISFSGFMLLPSYLSDDQLNMTLNYVVLSAVFVSLISFYEYFYMWPVLGDYWRVTGGYRSVSTMLNPNNLGVYLGMSLLILLLHSRFAIFWRFLAIVIITAALLMSGSRTAVVSIVIPLIIGLLFSHRQKLKINGLLLFVIFLCVFSGFVVSAFITGYLSSGRYFNFETAVIRLDKYFSYLSMFDASYLSPDFKFARSFYVSESSYFYFLNTFGFLLSAFFGFLYLVFFRINWAFISLFGPRRILMLIVLYYGISFMFENMIASFPNNQFFFFALGAILLPRRIDSRTRGCYV